jgi:mannosyltransferase
MTSYKAVAEVPPPEKGPRRLAIRSLSGRNDWARLLPLMALAVVLGLIGLGSKGLWLDEGLSAAIARTDPLTAFTAAWNTQTPGAIALYYEILHFWTILGNSEFVLRLLSVLCTALAVPVVYFLGRRLAGSRAALIAAFLIAASPFVVRYSQEARPYTMVLLLSAATSLALLRAIEQPTWRRWIGYAVLAITSLYVHDTMAFVFLVHGMWVLATVPIRNRRFWRCVVAFGAIGLSALPLAGLLSEPIFTFVPPMTLSWLGSVLGGMAGGTDPLLVFWLGAVGLGTVASLGRFRQGRHAWSMAFAVALGLVPILVEVAISVRYPMLERRYLMVSVPGLAVCAGIGIAAIPWDKIRWLSVALFVALAVVALIPWYSGNPKEGWREAEQVIAAGFRPGDGIVVYPRYCRLPFDYYILQDGSLTSSAVPVYPFAAWGRFFPVPNSDTSIPSSLDDIRPVPRLWIVSRYAPLDTSTTDGKTLWSHLPGYQVVETVHLTGVDVELVQSTR